MYRPGCLPSPRMSKKKKKPPTSSSPEQTEDIEKSLAAIYADETGAMPDLTKIEHARPKWWGIAIASVVVFAVTAALAAVLFTFSKPYRGFSGDAFLIAIEGPEHVAVGRETTYFINYRNRASEPLAQTELRISFPSDFAVHSIDPPPTESDAVWRLGSLGIGGRGTVTVRGTFTGALGTMSAIQVVGFYRPASFNSDFETLSTKALTYTESVLEGEISLPDKVLPGDRVTVAYAIQNTGEDALEGLRTRVTFPEGFTVENADGTANTLSETMAGRTMDFEIGGLEAGSSTTVEVTGSFAAGVSGEELFRAETGRLDEDGSFLAAERSDAVVTVLAGDLSLDVVVNGQDKEVKLPYGGVLRMAVRYGNTASEDLEGIRMRLVLEPESGCRGACTVDWETYADTASGTPRANAVAWDAELIPGLARVIPHEEGGVDLSVQGLPAEDGRDGLSFRAYVEAEIATIGGTAVQRTVTSAPVRIRYVTDAAFGVAARYFLEEGAPVGAGPLPPEVGRATTYRVEWDITKSFHELDHVTIRAPLSKIASWTGNTIVTAGEIRYDAEAGEVVWTLNRMPEGVARASVAFDVTVTPTAADANRFAKIMGPSRFEATDVTAEYAVSQTQPEITTDLRHDEYAEGKGVVRETE